MPCQYFLPHQEERLARQAAEARAQAAESLLQIAERCAWAETAVRQAWEDRLLETEAVLPIGRTQESLASQGWDGSTPLASASVRKRSGVHGPGMRTAADRVARTRGAARQLLSAHPVPQRVVEPLRQ